MPLTTITHEKNSQRKAHRINIPLKIIINNNIFRVTNWSVNGMGIELDANVDFNVGETLEASVVLMTGESSIVLDVEITIRSKSTNYYGVEITRISDKNKRVLRHYASLAIDGDVNRVDDLSTNLFMQNVASPINDPISLTDKEEKAVKRSFLKRFFIYLFIFVVFMGFFINIIVYNYVVIKDSVGVISGNSAKYFAPYDGVIKDIYVRVGDRVSKEQVLFEMQNENYEKQIKLLKTTQKTLKDKVSYLKNEVLSYKNYSRKKLQEIGKVSKSEVDALKEQYKSEEKTYKKAQLLYKNQLISFREFSLLQSNYKIFMDKYNKVINNDFSTNKDRMILEQNYMKNNEQILSLNNSIDSLTKEIQRNNLELQALKDYTKKALIYSHTEGVIYNINNKPSDAVKYAQTIMLIQTYAKPFILTKALSDEISSIELGSKVVIYSSKKDKVYDAHITGIGYPSIDGIDVGAQELSQNEIPIKIEFDDKNISFDLNEYVDIYILNNSNISKFLFKNIVRKLI
jgi:multidrug resistance efflux pump